MDTPPVTPDMEAIIGAIGRYPDGATYDDIVAGLSKPLPKGKVVFLAQQLETMGRIRSEKSAGTVHYFLVQSTPISKPDAAESATTLAQTASPSAEPAGAAPTEPKAESTSTVAQQPPVSSVPPSTGVQGPVAQPAKIPPAQTSSNDGSAGAPQTSPVQPAPSSNGPTDSATAKAGGAGAGAADALFAAAFADCVFKIVAPPVGGGKGAALYLLQQQAIEAGVDLKAFVAYGKARLEKLTKNEAENYAIEPEQFDSWHRRYFEESSVPPTPKKEPSAEETTAAEPERTAKKRTSSASGNTPATPKGIAKFLAKHVEPYVPEEFRPYVRWAVVIIGGALLTPLIVLLNTHPWQALGVIAGVIAVAVIVVVVRKRLASADGAAPADQGPGTKDEGPGGAEAPSGMAQTAGAGLSRDSESAAPSPGRPRRGLYILAFGGAALVVAIAAGAYFWLRPARPSIEAISAQLVKSAAPLPVRVAAIKVTYLPGSEVSLPVQYQARFETTETLFQSVNAAKYLQAHFAAEYAVITAAEKILAGPDAPRIRAAAGAAPDSNFSVSACRLFSVSSPPGTAATVSGTVSAWQKDGAWVITSKPLLIDRTALVGDPKPASAFAVDFPEDETRLKSLIAEQAAYAAKVQSAATALAADLERERVQAAAALERERQQKAADLVRENQQKTADLERERQKTLTALNQLLQRGTFFSGTFVDDTQQAKHPVLLEVTDCSATTHQITLLLRSTSGWYKTRTGQGDWSIEADGETCKAKVRFSSLDRIPGAGAPLDDTSSFFLTLRVYPDGTVAADPITWELQRVATADVADTKAEFGFATPAKAVAKESGVKDSGARSSEPTIVPTVGARPSRDPAFVVPSSGGSSVPTVGAGLSRDSGSVLQNPDSSHPDSSSSATLSAADLTFLSVAASPAAYARVDGSWVRLPTNSAKALQSVPQKLTGVVASLGSLQDKLAGKPSSASIIEAGEIKFDGLGTVPAVPAKDVIIVYVGPLAPFTADDVARHPELKDYPMIELAPEKTLSNGVRYASLYRVASGFLGFGSSRVMNATVEAAAPNLTVLRGTAPLPRGRYALSCGSNAYELVVE